MGNPYAGYPFSLIGFLENILVTRVKPLYFIFVLFLSFFFAAGYIASEDNADTSAEVDANNIIHNLKQARPDLEFSILGQSPIPDIYEVQIKNGPVLFVHKAGEYFFQGALLKAQPSGIIDTTEARKDELRREIFAKRSTDDMIIFSPKGELKAIMNVFTDVDCGYCRKFHQEVSDLNAMGIEVRYLAYPRAGIPSSSYNKIAKAWCAKDQQVALTKVKNGKKIDTKVCDDNPVAEHFALGASMGVTGTPAIVLMDGTLIPGYQPAENFAELLGVTNN